MEETVTQVNPLDGLNWHFSDYLTAKKQDLAKRMDGNGVPNYAYSMDYELRKKLDSIPGLMKLVRMLNSTVIPQELQTYNMQGIAVGPNQYPEIYQMVCTCARILGIAIPNLLIVKTIDFGGGVTSDFNACTIATDDVEPLILVTGLVVEKLSPMELMATNAHECGHIHNYHGVYDYIGTMIANIGMNGLLALPGISQLANLLTSGTQLALRAWSRASEVSADRAALICTGDLEACMSGELRFMSGAYMDRTVEHKLNIDAMQEQLDMTLGNVHRLKELTNTHPLTIKRMFAYRDFYRCEKFYEWRPDLKKPDMELLTKEETDNRCKEYLNVVMPKGGK